VTSLDPLLDVGHVVVNQDAVLADVVHLATLVDADEVLSVHGGNVLAEPVDLAHHGVLVSSLGQDVAGDALSQQLVQGLDVLGEGRQVRQVIALERQSAEGETGMEIGQHAIHVPVENLVHHFRVPLALDVSIIPQIRQMSRGFCAI